MKLSILILSTKSRANFLTNLLALLKPQLTQDVEIILEIDNGELSIGEKRNMAMKRAKGKYVTYVDCDDEISKDYVKLIKEAIKSNPDCCSLTGVLTWDGENPEIFEHSIKYTEWKTNDHNHPRYERYPNHLNVIRKSIAEKYSFIPVNHGEDKEWSTRIFEAKEIKTESTIKEILYHYKYRNK